jgi:hypothetical protein
MHDTFMIVGEEFRNVERDGQVIGFQIGARLPYYRGIFLALFGGLDLVVDGERFSREQVTVTVHGNTYTLAEMETETEDRWEFGEVAIITVRKPGGLAPGEHKVQLKETVLMTYVPEGFSGQDTKVLQLAG